MWPTLITLWFALSGNTPQRPAPRRRPAFRRPSSHPRLEALEDRCLLSLDPTFGSGGLVTSAIGTYQSGAEAVIVQPDGKIVAGGFSQNTSSPNEFALARYNANGTLDNSFGNKGIVQTVVGNNGFYISGLALQSDGKIVAVGIADSSRTTAAFAVVRYNPNGSLDTTFGGGKHPSGIVLTDAGSSSNPNGANAVAIQGDGKIDVAGASIPNKSNLQDFTLVRYNANGTLDTTFGPSNNGIVITQVGTSSSSANALAIQSDGKIVVVAGRSYEGSAGGYTNVMAAVRYTPTGRLDSSFGTNGIVTGLIPAGYAGAGVSGVLILGNGEIILSGASAYPAVGGGYDEAITLGRLTSTGQLDTTFGSAGFAIDPVPSGTGATAVGLGTNGDLLAAGGMLLFDNNNNAIRQYAAVAAFLPGGALDTTFGTNGTAIADFGFSVEAKAMAIQGDGRIVVAGFGQERLDLARFLPLGLQIDSFTASPNPVTSGSSITLTVSNITDSNPGGSITQVAFYVNSNGTNTLLGYGTQTSPGVWTLTYTVNLPPGTYTLFAQAEDNFGIFSDPVATTLTVQ